MLLAKYYDSESLGIISIINIVNLFGFSLAEAGVCNYVIYKGKVDKVCFSTIQWIVFSLSALMSLLTLLIYLFDYHIVICNSIVMASLCFPILALGVVQYSKLISDYRFIDLLYVEASFRLSFVVFVFYIVKYNFFDSLIYGYVVSLIFSYLIRFLFINFVSRGYGFVSYEIKFDLIVARSFLRFYASQIGSNAVNAIGNKLDEVIVLSSLGLSRLGQYFIIKQFVMQAFAAFYQVKRRLLMPLWSRGEAFNVDRCFYISFSIVTLVTLISYALNSFIVHEVIVSSFNFNLTMLSSVTPMVALRYMSGNLQCAYFQVKGEPYVELYWNLIQTIFISILILCVAIFFHVSRLDSFVMSMGVAYFISALIGYVYFYKNGLRPNPFVFVLFFVVQLFLMFKILL